MCKPDIANKHDRYLLVCWPLSVYVAIQYTTVDQLLTWEQLFKGLFVAQCC